MRDRHADRRGARARRGGALAPLLRAADEGRGLLGELGQDGRAVRRRRPRGEAHRQALELVARLPRARVVAADRRARGLVPRPRRPAARDQGRGAGHALADARALRPRRRDRAPARARAGDRGGHPGPRRALGRQRPAVRAAPRGDPAARAHRLPRPDGRDLPRRRRPRGGLRDRGAAQRRVVRPRTRASAACLPRRRDLLGVARAPRRLRLGARGPAADRRRRPTSTGSRPRSPASST